LLVAGISFIGYLIAGLVQNVFVVLGVSLVILLAVLFVLRALNKKQA